MIKHWSVDTSELKKDPDAYAIWRLEQWVNWGIGADKALIKDLVKYWDKLDIDVWKKKALHQVIFA